MKVLSKLMLKNIMKKILNNQCLEKRPRRSYQANASGQSTRRSSASRLGQRRRLFREMDWKKIHHWVTPLKK